MKKILITGGAGFIGAHLAKKLLADGHNSVFVLDKLTYASNISALDRVWSNPRFKFKQVDISENKELTKIFRNFAPDFVINMAAESHVDNSILNPEIFVKSNILGTFSLLETSRGYFENLNAHEKKKFRFYQISTDEVFGDLEHSGGKFNENSQYKPSSPYSASKAAADHLVNAWWRTYKLPTLISYCTNNYGPFQLKEKFIPKVISNALAGKRIPIYGNGRQIRDWIFVDDHVNAVEKILFHSEPGEKFCIGGKSEKENIEVALMVCKALETAVASKNGRSASYTKLIQHVEDRAGHDLRYAVDYDKIHRKLGWQPEVALKDGIRKTVDWFLENSKI